MLRLGFEPGVAGLDGQADPLSYAATPTARYCSQRDSQEKITPHRVITCIMIR